MVFTFVLISAPAYRLGFLSPRTGTRAAFVMVWVHSLIMMVYNRGVYAAVCVWQPFILQVWMGFFAIGQWRRAFLHVIYILGQRCGCIP